MSERGDSLNVVLAEANVALREWQTLLESPGWQRLVAFCIEQRNMRKELVLMTPVDGEHTAYKQEMMKGEALGIGLVLSYPETQKEMAEMQVRTLTKEVELEDEADAAEQADVSRVDDPNTFGGAP